MNPILESFHLNPNPGLGVNRFGNLIYTPGVVGYESCYPLAERNA